MAVISSTMCTSGSLENKLLKQLFTMVYFICVLTSSYTFSACHFMIDAQLKSAFSLLQISHAIHIKHAVNAVVFMINKQLHAVVVTVMSLNP